MLERRKLRKSMENRLVERVGETEVSELVRDRKMELYECVE